VRRNRTGGDGDDADAEGASVTVRNGHVRSDRERSFEPIVEPDRHPGAVQAPPRPTGARARVRVAVAIREPAFHREVFDHLTRQPSIDVVSSLTDPEDVRTRVGSWTSGIDAIVVCPTVARSLADRIDEPHPPVFLVAEEMTVPVLRTAIEVGAQGAFCWPEERADLSQAIPPVRDESRGASPVRGRVVAMLGARGGVGVTFLASHLAAAFARKGLRVVLVDHDPGYGDLAAALGFLADRDARSMEDLVQVMDELGPEHVLHAISAHAAGFDVLLSRSPVPSEGPTAGERGAGRPIPTGLLSACTALLAGDYQVVVLHVARTLDPVARAAVHIADETILVAGLDLMSLYGARRTLSSLRPELADKTVRIVVNATRSPEVSAAEFERVLGQKPSVRIRADRAVASALSAGRVLAARNRGAWRDVVRLSEAIGVEPAVVSS
jgi:cellulose biosynthesis protein BcsQ